MGTIESILLITAALLVLFGLGQGVAFAMVLVGVIGLFTIIGPQALNAVGTVLYQSASNPVLVSMPLFIFMSELLVLGGVSTNLYKGLTPWLGRLPGGLLHSNIGACAIFAAISGSSPATAATIGTVAIPELEKRRYDPEMMLGSICGGGTLGILIPPSITMVVYCSMVGESVGRQFAAGVIPGIMLAGLFMLYIVVWAVFNPKAAPPILHSSWKDSFVALLRILPAVILILMVLGTMFAGWATATEASAIGVVGSFLLGLFYRTINRQSFKTAILNTAVTTCSIMIIFVGANFIAILIAYAGVPLKMAGFVTSLAVPPLVIMLAIYIIYLILGSFFDPMSMMVLTLPILMPVIKTLGFDPIWFGIVLVILIEAGMLTPPVGLNLYVMQSIAPKYSFEQVVKGSMPFFLMQLAGLAILTAFPSIATWLPSIMFD